MDITYSSAENEFREEVRAFIAAKLPDDIRRKVRTGKRLSKQDHETWHSILAERGWLATGWPKKHGGPGWGPVEKYIFEEEYVKAGAPRIVPFGLTMLGPVLIKYGSEDQKQYHLPRILDGTDWWCQGYSEPGAGSDLASLKTKAVRDGEDYIVNGQKTWTTLGHHANRIFCLVRTDGGGKPQEGISFLLIDMHSPGVEVRPIITIDGEHEVNEVFFSDVRVPAANLVGEENKGWTYAKYLLSHERTNIAGVGFATHTLAHLKTIATRQMKGGRPLIDDAIFASRMMELEIELDAMRTTNLRMIAAAQAGGEPGPEASMLKIKGTDLRQRLNNLTRQALGPYALPFVSEALDDGSNAETIGPDEANTAAMTYFNTRKLSIFGGSNEIQRNIIAKQILGL